FLLLLLTPIPTSFPYTTLFRSFNPPRYMKLLELIPASGTDPAIVEGMRQFCTKRLGKGVVIARDTPNFIANRIGTYGLLVTLEEDRKSTRLNSSHVKISYAVFC